MGYFSSKMELNQRAQNIQYYTYTKYCFHSIFFFIFSPLCVSMLIEKSDAKCDFETHDASTSHDSDHHRVKILDTILEEKRRRQIDEDSFPEIKKTPPEKIKYSICT